MSKAKEKREAAVKAEQERKAAKKQAEK